MTRDYLDDSDQPPFRGGQGRSAPELRDDCAWLAWCVLILAALLLATWWAQ